MSLAKPPGKTGFDVMICFATVSFVGSVVFPWLVAVFRRPSRFEDEIINEPKPSLSENTQNTLGFRIKISIRGTWISSQVLFFLCMWITIIPCPVLTKFALMALGLSWSVTQWAPFAVINEEIAKSVEDCEGTGYAATINSLHNIAIALPQVIAALGCSFLFWALQKAGVQDCIGWVFRITSFSALYSAYLVSKLVSE
jgi:hypothetical protein